MSSFISRLFFGLGFESMSEAEQVAQGTAEGDEPGERSGSVQAPVAGQEHGDSMEAGGDDGSGAIQPPNVISQPELTTEPKPASIQMPTISISTDLNIQLHSPSTHIVGTPFEVHNASPFEYPFPSQSSSSKSRSPSMSTDSFTSLPNLSSSPDLSSHGASSSTSPRLPPTFLPPYSQFPLSPNSYSPAHPKLRPVDPPVPPTLAKKGQRWSMGLVSRRKRGAGSDGASSDGTSPSVVGGDEHGRRYSVDTPYTSPRPQSGQSPPPSHSTAQ